jgi:DNA-binding transcriptional LysR family regulator
MVRVSIDIVFFKNELLRMSVSVLRTIELDALQIFKAVVDFGGVTRAAAHLHRVPSNVTTRLKQLEEGLGTKLFHRHSRKLLLSSEGNLLLAFAEQLLRLSAEAELVLRSGKPRGKLRIGTLESTAATRLPPVLARYHRANDSRRAPRAGISLCDRGRFRRRTFRVSRLGDDAGLSRKARCNRPEGNYRD